MNNKKDNYLQKPLVRGLILFPPLFFIIIGMIIGSCGLLFDFSIYNPSIIFIIYIISVVYLLIGLTIILYSDFRNNKIEKFYMKNKKEKE